MPLTLKPDATTTSAPLSAELLVLVFEDSHGGDDVNLVYEEAPGQVVDFAYMAGWHEHRHRPEIPTDQVLANAQRLRDCWNACLGIEFPRTPVPAGYLKLDGEIASLLPMEPADRRAQIAAANARISDAFFQWVSEHHPDVASAAIEAMADAGVR